ncbi:hypothetical protein BDK51DRAFT_39206 [Blyttiomyces helicus]|uniref:Uncharacterized protein n=1 Tax=Blyttiomyces helicus TaxID=388810 RepID=A0A4V1IS05_9FUNG|nr:hypothetical protein BDK51DRAFT_39206 [Blyttiomyces helicus]|eukprot:RKO91877.1 hypothetical protein BDK51DRAFT_39206 [Blyttiomyces helicus]
MMGALCCRASVPWGILRRKPAREGKVHPDVSSKISVTARESPQSAWTEAGDAARYSWLDQSGSSESRAATNPSKPLTDAPRRPSVGGLKRSSTTGTGRPDLPRITRSVTWSEHQPSSSRPSSSGSGSRQFRARSSSELMAIGTVESVAEEDEGGLGKSPSTEIREAWGAGGLILAEEAAARIAGGSASLIGRSAPSSLATPRGSTILNSNPAGGRSTPSFVATPRASVVNRSSPGIDPDGNNAGAPLPPERGYSSSSFASFRDETDYDFEQPDVGSSRAATTRGSVVSRSGLASETAVEESVGCADDVSPEEIPSASQDLDVDSTDADVDSEEDRAADPSPSDPSTIEEKEVDRYVYEGPRSGRFSLSKALPEPPPSDPADDDSQSSASSGSDEESPATRYASPDDAIQVLFRALDPGRRQVNSNSVVPPGMADDLPPEIFAGIEDELPGFDRELRQNMYPAIYRAGR